MARVLSDSQAPARLRVTAAEMLGRIATPAALDALRASLAIDDAVVLRSVARGLGRAADLASLPDLERLAGTGGVASTAAAGAVTLVRFRHGAAGDALPPVHALLPPLEGVSRVVATRTAPRAVAEAALADVRGEVSGLGVSPDRGIAFTCDESRLMVLLTADGRAPDVDARIRAKRRVLAVIVEQLALEDDTWELDGLVVSEPAGDERARLALVGRSGVLRMDGEAVLTRDRADLSLTRVEAPGAVPAYAAGTLGEGRLRIRRLEVGTARHRPLVPVRLRPEPGAGSRAPRG
jgi:hypothetical protein